MSLKSFVFLVVIILIILFYFNLNMYDIVLRKNEKCDCDKLEDCYFNNIINMDKLIKPKIFVHMDDYSGVSGLTRLCVESLMNHCYQNYDIILYTNEDIVKMIDDDDDLCNIEHIDLLGGQDLKQWEEYCKFKIIHKYGGVVMRPNFLFSECPKYEEFCPERLKICRVNNEGVNVSNKLIIPSFCYMIAGPENDGTTKIYLDYLRKKCRHNYTSDIKHFDKTFEKLHYLDSFSEEKIGVVDSNQQLIHLENILSSDNISFASNNYCLFVNIDLLNKKRHQGWILNMNKEQILETNTLLSNYAKL